jgi:ADP-ribosyl-[dinitrogen reductase] hydrolase
LEQKTNLAIQPPNDPVQQDRALAAYAGLAIGDALGATVEFMTAREIQSHFGVHRKIIGGGWLKLKPGQVTDDTEMSLSLGRAILEAQAVNARSIAQAYSDWMRSKPADIGNTVRRGIVHYRNSGDCTVPFSEHDAGNGACMRSLPLALAMLGADETELRHASRIQAHITHNNDVSDLGTECVMRMVQCAIQGGEKQDLENLAEELIASEPLYAYRQRPQENPSGYIVETLRAVFQAFFANEDFETAMLDVVNRGGDADTTGAILGMIAGAYYGFDAIPRQWRKAMDQDLLQQCHEQALALLQLAPVKIVLSAKD